VGEQLVSGNPRPEELRHFMKCLLNDVWALETMLRRGMIETGVRRIGAEQELVLVEDAYRPALMNIRVLEALNDPLFTTELAQFNVEANLPPLSLGGDCLRQVEDSLIEKVEDLRKVVRGMGADVVLTGILPTLRVQDICMESMTPMERYRALNDALSRLRGDPYELRINGADELIIKHDSVMLEACNTSFQVHLQVDPEDFARSYNIAQLLAAPVLAAAVNSPLLFGRRLWNETRVAVFQQAVDTRTSSYYLQDHSSRVHFGRRWVQKSALELFQEDIARFRVLLGTGTPPPDPFEELNAGRPPKLKALQLHNSTVYRWNRACYGISEGKPHLRIENRVLPAGPSVLDEVSNAAFWLGLMQICPRVYGDVKDKLPFEDCRANFVAAARRGLAAQLTWLNGKEVPVTDLILDELLPMARTGLEQAKIDPADIDRYLGVVEERVRSRQTGAKWQLASLDRMKGKGTLSQQLCALTAATIEHQLTNTPGHEWPLANLASARAMTQSYMSVEQIMTTDVYTVNQEELLELVARIMDWKNIRYVPVEDDQLHLVGLISHRAMLRYLARDVEGPPDRNVPVKQIMHRLQDDLVTISPETLTIDALEKMRAHRVGCLPVVKDDRLVGIVTERDFMRIAAQLLEQQLRAE
jgi:CBS domain-containing protein